MFRVFLVIFGVFFVLYAWTSTPAGLAQGVVGLVVGLVSGWAVRQRSRIYVAITVLAGYLAIVGINVVETFVAPSPLPSVVLETGQGEVRGGLVAFAEPTWFVRSEGRTVLAIDAALVRKSTIYSPKSAEPRKIGEFIRDELGL